MFERDSFFTPGGTLPPNSASYVRRKADGEIVNALFASDLVYILDSRQKGKSSLIVRAIAELQLRGISTARIDFQRLGNNLAPEQWYAGLLHSIGQELGKTEELFAFWKRQLVVGPALRFFAAIEEVILRPSSDSLVIFIDEVDFCQALPFSVDEFFAGIRQLFNRRSESDIFRRITFCLVGVASPSQLIKDQDVTPFNVGRRIELPDFTRAELQPYADEISRSGRDGSKLIDRIFYWVKGHPYLTQLLASEVAGNLEVERAQDVDDYVKRTLFSAGARQREPNLADAERRLLETRLPNQTPNESRSRILELHALMLANSRVPARHDEPAVLAMMLSGIAIEEDGCLKFRNRLYRTLFDEKWRQNNLPDAEARRQRVASRRGTLRAVWVSAACFAVIGCFVIWLLVLASSRDKALAESRRQGHERLVMAYQTSIALASETLNEGNPLKALSLLRSQPDPTVRGWEWSYLKNCLADPTEVAPPLTDISSADPIFRAWLERGSVVSFRGLDLYLGTRSVGKFANRRSASYGSIWLWFTRDTAPLDNRFRHVSKLLAAFPRGLIALHPDGVQVAVFRESTRQIEFNNTATRIPVFVSSPTRPVAMTYIGNGRFLSVYGDDRLCTYDCLRKVWMPNNFWPSPTNKYMLMSKREDSRLQVRRVDNNAFVCELNGHTAPVGQVVWFNDESRVVTYAYDHTVRVWNIKDGREVAVYATQEAGSSIGLSPDERSILYVTAVGSVLSWPVSRESERRILTKEAAEVSSIAISPDGSRCAGYCQAGFVRMIDLRNGSVLPNIPVGKFNEAPPTVFSPDGRILLLVSVDGNLIFVNPSDGRILRRLSCPGGHPYTAAISKNGHIAVTLREGGVLLMDSWKGSLRQSKSATVPFTRVALSKTGELMALGTFEGSVLLVNTREDRVEYVQPIAGSYITSVEFSPSERSLSASSRDSRAYLIDLTGSHSVKTLAGHSARVWQARFSPDEKWVLTTSFDGTARVWETATGKPVSVLQHDSWVAAAEWSPDSRRIVTACADQFLRIFAPENGFELLKLRGHKGFVLDVLFSPDGKSILSSGEDHTIRLWQTGPIADVSR